MVELAPPGKSVELEDPGAHELEQLENDSDVFADAQEGQQPSSGSNSPIPITRVEKVDDRESHGDVPGTEAYKMRTQDAVPDEVEVIPEGNTSRRGSWVNEEPGNESARATPIPKTVVEKLDTEHPGHGEVPGTTAYKTHRADAVPDEIYKASGLEASSPSEPRSASSEVVPVPRTVITRVDSKPAHGEVPGTEAYDMRKGDAEPDVLEKKGDVPDLPTSSLNRSTRLAFGAPRPSMKGAYPIAADGGFGPMTYKDEAEKEAEEKDDTNTDGAPEDNDGFGDDFDDFEAGAGDDDFGDFDDGFEQPPEPSEFSPPKSSAPAPESPFSLLDFRTITDLPTLLTSTASHLDALFPSTTQPLPAPPSKPPSTPNPIFPTPRAASLWTQLVAPPPLQPPNWVRSRIRRLFLVSLGVPIDLDAILPASKQKKLILPSTLGTSPHPRRDHSHVRGRLENSSTASLEQQSKGARKKKGPPPEPELDLGAVRRLCATTEEALAGKTEAELEEHVQRLEGLEGRAREVLGWWERRREEKVGDKEAFEGVIANLVRHAKRVRK